jgi:hypothetical protein
MGMFDSWELRDFEEFLKDKSYSKGYHFGENIRSHMKYKKGEISM